MKFNPIVEQKIALIPENPGVYLMYDEHHKIIYVGKAKNLYNRVSQYFLRPQVGKVHAMVKRIADFDTIITPSEKEALILELNLIKTHYPRYNIMLKDDSHYPYIAINKKGDPTVKIARKACDNRYIYYGPYPNSSAAYEVVNLINRLFKTRKCPPMQKGPCLYYHLGQCAGYCFKEVSEEEKKSIRLEIGKFLNSDNKEMIRDYEQKLKVAIDDLRFEEAKEFKQISDALKHVFSRQTSEIKDKLDRDVFAFSQKDGYLGLTVMLYRGGKLLGKEFYVVSSFDNDEDLITNLILQYYENKLVPKQILIGNSVIANNLRLVLDSNIIVPRQGKNLNLINNAQTNVIDDLNSHFYTRRIDEPDQLLMDLESLLKIEYPTQIDLFDNAHLQGSDAIGVMVCFINGQANKKLYRKYNISDANKQDDYGAMREALTRHYQKKLSENNHFPNLLIVDGGMGQVNVAKEVREALGLSFPIAGLFKNDKHQTKGLLDEAGNVIEIDHKSKLFFLLMRLQEEVHRFAITSHRNKRRKGAFKSILDDVKGLGAKRKQLLTTNYPDINDLRKASLEELSQVIPLEIAKSLKLKLDEASNN